MKETKPGEEKPVNAGQTGISETSTSGTGRRLSDDSDERLHELRVYQAELEMQNEELRAAQEALAESRDRFSTLFHRAPVGYVVLDEVGLILEANETFARMVHCPMDRIRGRAFAAFLEEEHSRTFQSRFRALFRNPKGKRMEVELRSVERSLSVQLDASYADSIKAPSSSKASALLLTVSDISDRKRAEEDRRHSLSLLEAALESTADGILIVASDGTWSGFNQKFIDMWRIPEPVLKSGDDRRALEHVLDVVADPDGFLDTVKEIHGDSHRVSLDTVTMKDGRILERYSQPHRVGDETVGRVWSFRDTTDHKRDRKRLEEALREARRHQRETQGLLDASHAVLECRSFEESARRIFDACREATGAPSGYIALLSEDGEENELVFLESGGLPCAVDPALPMPVRGLRAEAYNRAEVVYDNDFMNSKWVRYMPPGHMNMRNVLFAPIVGDGKAVGVIGLANKPDDFTPEDVRIARALGDMAAIALRRSEQLMETILDTIPAPVFYKDLQGVYLGCNRAFQKLFGLSKDDIVGRTALDIAPPELARRYHQADLALMEHGEIQVYETEAENALGERRQVVFHKAPFRGPGGAVMGIVGAMLDITERQQAERRLKNAHEQTTALMDSVQAGIVLVQSEDRVIVEANPAAARLMNVPMEELIGNNAKKYLCPREVDECPVLDLGQELEDSERTLYTPDGRTIPILKTVTRIKLNGQEHLLESFVDISSLKQAEEELRAGEARMRAITESAQDGIVMMNPDGNISFWNTAAERIFGYGRDEVVGVDLHSLLAPRRYLSKHRKGFSRFRATGLGSAVGKTLELQARHKHGQEVSVELSLSAIRQTDGWHAVGVIRDITERKRAEEELLEINRQLEDATARANAMALQAEMANIAKSEFLANMSHEIRTPMNGVIGMTGLLLDTGLTEEQRRYAEIVKSSGESLLSIINDILDFSKIEAGKLDLEVLDFDLRELLDDFSATMALRAHEKGLEWLCSADPEVPSALRGDPGRLRQILTNLAGNAVKFTQTGEVAVRVSLESETADDTVLKISVRDTGIGIPEKKLTRLFGKFFQVDASTTRRFGGTGLGLAISKQLAEMMGGEVGVDSREGQGSEFRFTVRLGKQPPRECPESGSTQHFEDVRVLVVDDNATNREVLSKRLSFWGMRPQEAQDGPSALEALSRGTDEDDPFRVAVIDMQMPGMDGEDLARAVKGDPRISATPMVMLTSLGVRSDGFRPAETGIVACLNKPTRDRELFGVLSKILAGRDPDGALEDEAAGTTSKREASIPFSFSNKRVLLAEDNLTNQQVALAVLKKFGIQADVVSNGAEAVRALGKTAYDLVLMDVQMPVMDGLEAARRIRKPRSAVLNHEIPIIAMTARALKGDREKCLESGMNDYLPKPIEIEGLAEVLHRWLGMEEEAREKREPEEDKALEQDHEVFDRKALLQRLMNDEELMKTIVGVFLSDMPVQMALLKASLDRGDPSECERLAHSIKGASAGVGGEGFRAAALQMEQASRSGNLNEVKALYPELEMRFEQLKAAMEHAE